MLATKKDPATARLLSPNCKGAEEVRRFQTEYSGRGAPIEEFYSNSLSAAPMVGIATAAYMVQRGRITPWPAVPRGKFYPTGAGLRRDS